MATDETVVLGERGEVGPYTLISRLGEGAFGSVWLAKRRSAVAEIQVAVKLPRCKDIDLEMVRNEAKIWALAAGHPNVLPIIDADIYGDLVVIASEYAPSGSLAEWLEQHGGAAPSVAAAAEMASGILAGVEHLHARDIVHRDIKPANILLQGQTPRLADFGLSRFLVELEHSARIAGSPAYMAPETFDGDRTKQTDIWAVGVVFYQMLGGCLPFKQRRTTELIKAILTEPHAPLPESVPKELRDLVDRALEKDPGHRFNSAAEMHTALQEILARIRPYGHAGVLELADNNLGRDIRIGGSYRSLPMRLVAGSWTKYYELGWARSGWLYIEERTRHLAEDFFKIHLLPNGRGYIHILCSSNPQHSLWMETGTGERLDLDVSWSEVDERTFLWHFGWKA